MFFTLTPLRDKIIKLILNNPIPNRDTDILNPYVMLSVTLFFSKYHSVILNELYYKGLIELHGDVTLFKKAKSLRDTKYLKVSASLTQKGMAYYRLHIQKDESNIASSFLASATDKKHTLHIVR